MRSSMLVTLLLCSFLLHAQKDSTLYGYVDSTTFKPALLEPTPVGRANRWKNYLADNLKYPRSAKKKKIAGTVVVDFTVDAKGNTSDYKVFHSVDPALDEEAVRLIKETGLWAPAAGPKGGNVAYRMRKNIEFKLEE